VKVRPATPADLAALAGLERELFGPDAWSTTLLAPVLSGSRAGSCLVAAHEGRVVGYVVTSLAGDTLDLQRLGVQPPHRRRGVARALVEAALADASQVLLEVGAGNEGAIAFYEAEGFAEIARRRRYYRDGSDAVVMERRGRGTIGP
jgi:ribosomal protein S18 acetylase RimI-like enzyme